jgi:hypothetical protein
MGRMGVSLNRCAHHAPSPCKPLAPQVQLASWLEIKLLTVTLVDLLFKIECFPLLSSSNHGLYKMQLFWTEASRKTLSNFHVLFIMQQRALPGVVPIPRVWVCSRLWSLV